MRSRIPTLTLAALGLLLALVGTLASCGAPAAASGPEKPVIAVDGDGVTISIPARSPQRIISLEPSNSAILAALKVDARVIGVDVNTDYPADLVAKPKVTDANGKPNVEQIVALKPDLVLTYGYFTTDSDRLLRQAHITVVAVPVGNLSGMLQDVRLIGQLVHAEATANAVVDGLQHRIDAVKSKVKALPAVSVYMEVGYSPGQVYAFGGGTFADEMIRDAGGTNIFGSNTANSGYPQVSDESIIAANPQVIVLTEDPQYGGDPTQVAKRSGWSAIGAVQHSRIYQISADYTEQQSPRLVDGLEQLAKLLHPNAFK
jgi:iron complex transport system substrate-binding protein